MYTYYFPLCDVLASLSRETLLLWLSWGCRRGACAEVYMWQPARSELMRRIDTPI